VGPVLAGAIGGAAGSVASQAFGMATGLQQKFDWKGVAMGAISGAVGGAIGPGGAFGKLGAFAKVGSSFAQGALKGAISSLVTQGIGVATGLQKKFSWLGVATSALGGGLSNSVSGSLARDVKLGNISSTMADGLASGVSAVANAAARSLVTGTSFGDNLLAALPDVIGGTIGNMIAGRVQGSGSRGMAEESEGSSAYDGDGVVEGWEEGDSALFPMSHSGGAIGGSEDDGAGYGMELAALDLDRLPGLPGQSPIMSDFGGGAMLPMALLASAAAATPGQTREQILLREEMNREWATLAPSEQQDFRNRGTANHNAVHDYLYQHERLPGQVTVTELIAMGARSTPELPVYARHLTDAMARYGILSVEQRAAFMG
jgi:hypothetical protein